MDTISTLISTTVATGTLKQAAITYTVKKMGSQADYFNRIGYQPKYFLGDRVFGHWNKIPFIGSVGNDRVIDNTGPQITILLDLPIVLKNKVHNVIIVKHKDIKRLKTMDI